jgi:hypothetical protein
MPGKIQPERYSAHFLKINIDRLNPKINLGFRENAIGGETNILSLPTVGRNRESEIQIPESTIWNRETIIDEL